MSISAAPTDAQDCLALSLIATLTLHDIEDLKAGSKGKRSASAPVSDEELALQLYELEANALLTDTQDLAFAHSLDSALATDAELLGQLAQMEAGARADREMAVAISEGRPPPALSSTPRLLPGPSSSNGEEECTALVVASSAQMPAASSHSIGAPRQFEASRSLTASSSGKVHSRSLTAVIKKKREDCIICTESIKGPEIRAPCGHIYDIKCLTDLFRSATVDESLFPPRCCQQPFQLSEVRQYFSPETASAFEEKAIEFGTTNRLYCYRPTCSAFLGSATEQPSPLSCTKCGVETCGRCREAGHGARPCTTTTGDDDVSFLALAEQEGWKRCPNCRHMVELAHGCYHMTCRCRKEFCYVCTETWKTCACLQWDENRLVVAARNLVQRQLPGARPPPARMQEMVAQAVNRLRVDHDCRHSWRYHSGSGHCEQCNHYLPMYLFHCSLCAIAVCNRCRRNRM